MERIVELFREITDAQGIVIPSERPSLFDAHIPDASSQVDAIAALKVL
jgi:hypothetical protein